MRYSRIILGIVSSLLVVTSSIPPASAAESADWRTAYAQWLSKQEQSCDNDNVAVLCDLDLDGVPELFWGSGIIKWGIRDSTELTTGVSMKDGKLTSIYQLLPYKMSSKDDPNYEEAVYAETISQSLLIRDKNNGALHFIGPFIDQDTMYDSQGAIDFVRYRWILIYFEGGRIVRQYDTVLDSYTTGPQDGFGRGSTFLRGRIGGDVNNPLDTEEVTSEVFFARLQKMAARYQCLGNPAVSHTDTPEEMKSGAETAFWTEVNGKKQCNLAAIQKFLASWSPSIVLGDISAEPANAKVLLDSVGKQLPAYRFYDSHYIKLRDFAALLSGTAKQFGVTWDGTAVQLTSSSAYPAPVSPVGGKRMTARYSTQIIYLDGKEINIPSYQINGYNYIRLRDIAEVMNIPVDWNQDTETIVLHTK